MTARKNIAVLGSTGSVGRQALDLIYEFPDRFNVRLLSGHVQSDLLAEQVARFQPHTVVCAENKAFERLKYILTDQSIQTEIEPQLTSEILSSLNIDLVVNALPSIQGYQASIDCLTLGIDLALVNKESLVIAGETLIEISKKTGARIIPVDSEISAVDQCLRGESRSAIQEVILTTSGSFRNWIGQTEIKAESIVKHPVWDMGPKISVDSATMVNKAFEVQELKILYGLAREQISICIHPEVNVHGMVRFTDGNLKMLAGPTNMRPHLAYALGLGKRLAFQDGITNTIPRDLHFLPFDNTEVPCFNLIDQALQKGGNIPAAAVAANDRIVEHFLNGNILFRNIPTMLKRVLGEIDHQEEREKNSVKETLKEVIRITDQLIVE